MSLEKAVATILQISEQDVTADPSIVDKFILFNFRPGRITEGYEVNSYNCRSVEFFDNPELLIAGCSQTFGIGVPVEGSWPYFVSEALGVKYANTALPGGSTQTIVTNIFAYIRKFGKPKTIVMLLPEFARMTVVDVNGLVHRKYAGEPPVIRYEDLSFRDEPNNSGRQLYSRRPHKWEDVLPIQAPVAQSMSALTTLLQYCKDTGINLVWSSWDKESMDLCLELAKSEHGKDGLYNGCIDLSYDGLATDKVECHSELYEKHGELFHFAWDKTRNYNGHMSVHQHRHIADLFLKRLSN